MLTSALKLLLFGATSSASGDTTAPTISALDPADNATDVEEDAICTATFTEAIFPGAVALWTLRTGGVPQHTMDETDYVAGGSPAAGEWSTDGNDVILHWSDGAIFSPDDGHDILCDAGSVEDQFGNPFAGLAAGAWSFTVEVVADARQFSVGSGFGSLYVNSGNARDYALARSYVAEDAA